MKQSFLPIKKLNHKPYSTILGYPKATQRQILARINELEKIRVKSVSFFGSSNVNNLDILGKGYVGVVILAKKGSRKIALKIRRTDSKRKDMKSEAKFLTIANSVKVGPKLIDASRNFLLMEYLEGEKIGKWVTKIKGRGGSSILKKTIKTVLEDCFRLDHIGLDHGELSSISKHVIISENRAVMIDFESSSTKRRVSNVTSATQAIFIGSGISKHVNRIYKIPNKERIIDVLRSYKKEPTRKNFDELLKVLRL